MNPRSQLLLAMVFGLLAAVFARAYISGVVAEAPEPVLARVVIAASHIPAERELNRSDLSERELPVEVMIEGAARSIEEVLGKTALVPIYPNEQVLWQKLTVASPSSTLAVTLPAGYRGYTLRVGEAETFGGLLRPGDVVDIIATFYSSATEEFVTATVLTAVRVVAVGGSTGAGVRDVPDPTAVGYPVDRIPSSVTVALTLEQAKLVHEVRERTEVRLLLRPAGEEPADGGRSTEEILDLLRSPEEMEADPVSRRVEVVRGTRLEYIDLEEESE